MHKVRILKTSIYNAQKEHVCIWCGQKICIGDPYYYRVYVIDGHFYNDKMHAECAVIMDKTINNTPELEGQRFFQGHFNRPDMTNLIEELFNEFK